MERFTCGGAGSRYPRNNAGLIKPRCGMRKLGNSNGRIYSSNCFNSVEQPSRRCLTCRGSIVAGEVAIRHYISQIPEILKVKAYVVRESVQLRRLLMFNKGIRALTWV